MPDYYTETKDASKESLITLTEQLDEIIANTEALLSLARGNRLKAKQKKARRAPGTGIKSLIPDNWKDILFQGLKNIKRQDAFKLPDLLRVIPELRGCSQVYEFNRRAMKHLISIGVEVWAKPADGAAFNGPGAMRWLNETECSQWLTWKKRSIPYRDALKFRHHFTVKDFISTDDLI